MSENDELQSGEIKSEEDAVLLIELLEQQISLFIESSSIKDGTWRTRFIQTVRDIFSPKPIPHDLFDKTLSESPTELLISAHAILKKMAEVIVYENTMQVPPVGGGPAIVLDANKITRIKTILKAMERALSERRED